MDFQNASLTIVFKKGTQEKGIQDVGEDEKVAERLLGSN